CSCRTPLLKCGLWQAVGERIRAQGAPFSRDDAAMDYRSGGTPYVRRLLSPLHRGPLLEAVRDALLALSPQWRRDYPALRRRDAALIEAVLGGTGAQVSGDSSKTGVRLRYLCRNGELDVRALGLIRDGRA